MMDLSLLESLSSIAMTTQFAMMVMMMTQSKGGQLTSQVIIFLTGLVGVKRKREVGPRSSGSSFFFFLILSAQLTWGLQDNDILLWSGQSRGASEQPLLIVERGEVRERERERERLSNICSGSGSGSD